MRALRRRGADDTGASLLIAIAFMTFLGLVIASMLNYTGSSLRSIKATEERADSVYDIDGALQAAVNKTRVEGTFTNAAGQQCPGFNSPNPYFPGSNTSSPIAVTCVGGKGTGAASGPVTITPANRPAHAVLTLGSGLEKGIDKGAHNILLVRGHVYVNSTGTSIEQTDTACPDSPWPPAPGEDCSGLGVDNGTLTARGACHGTIVAPAGQACGDPGLPPAGDPSYAQPNSWTHQEVPACSGGQTMTFAPGYYDDAVALSALTNGRCKNKTMHFPAGDYYFDFHNGDGAPLPAGSHVWTISDTSTDVVGGTPKDWTPAGGKPTIPGSCVSPLESAANGGVQFVFGGDSRMDVQAGNVELCGQYSAGSPPIALYGARTGADPAITAPATGTTDGTGVSAPTGPPFTAPKEIQTQDGVASEADIVGGASDVTSEVALKGFTPPSLPAGSILDSAQLVAWHREQSAGGSTLQSLTVTLTPNRLGATPTTRPLTRYTDGPADGPFHQDGIDVKSYLADEVHKHGLNGLNMKYTATVNGGESVTERLDSLQLVLSWRPPAVRGQTSPVSGGPNCVGTVGGCPMIKTRPNARFYVPGTTYAPLALLDIQQDAVSAPVFSAGIIARALKIQLHATDGFSTGPTIAIPDLADGAPKPLEVYFRAYTCPPGLSAACAAIPAPGAPWRLAGTARARYEDPDIFSPTPPYDTVTVLSWAVRRT